MVRGAGALRERMLKIARIGDKIVAILTVFTVKGWLPALGKGVKGFILQWGFQNVIAPVVMWGNKKK